MFFKKMIDKVESLATKVKISGTEIIGLYERYKEVCEAIESLLRRVGDIEKDISVEKGTLIEVANMQVVYQAMTNHNITFDEFMTSFSAIGGHGLRKYNYITETEKFIVLAAENAALKKGRKDA